ncbi:hypothetical protein [Mangrovibrevibacter kandeliae]|uniref:hypothetical protein n=1 Tax=Mangrovibrevibacter kandeliae TaxID=2968473 RepID=UPI00211979FA|nr:MULTISPECIES: hypothetical protein [unclassified Aurantimonas]MCQ8780722.1 hypothetical protein [Aurantimonas sp. CSK15Z-1]MCW4113505.1 hypothetical protein [Aurantimonas sp. MSK8Z-1]
MLATALLSPLRPAADFYNALPDVMDANAHVTRLGRYDAIDRLIAIIVKHQLGDLVGLRLLHSHCPIEPGEAMVEDEELAEDAVVQLTTRPLTDGAITAAPNSWALTPDGWHPVEFSADEGVRRVGDRLKGETAFLGEMAAALVEMEATQTIGLCAFERRYFRFADPQSPTILVERTDVERRANVLRYAIEDHFEPGSLIETVWAASESDEPGTNCPTRCGMRCQIIMKCHEYSDGHRKTEVGHDKEHTGKEHWYK